MTGDEFIDAVRQAVEDMRDYRTPSPWPCVVPDWFFDIADPERVALMEKLWDCKYMTIEEYQNLG